MATQDKIKELIKDVKFTMMTTMTSEHQHRARPMTTIEVTDFSDGIWFLGDKTSSAVDDIKANPNVCLAYASPGKGDYVSITGEAQLIDDRAKLVDLWSDVYQAFYEDINDPDIQLVCVKPIHAEYWEGANSIVTFFKIAKAAITGEQAEKLGEKGEVTF